MLIHIFNGKNTPESIKDVVEMLDKILITFQGKTGAVLSLAHTVIQECEVGWNRKIHMIQSILRQYSNIRQRMEQRQRSAVSDGGQHTRQINHYEAGRREIPDKSHKVALIFQI